MKYFEIFFLQFKRAFLIQWEYKTNFLFFFLMQSLYFATKLAVLFVIFSYVPDIIGLTFYDLVMYTLIADVSGRLVHGSGLWIDDEVIKGNLNCLLIRPVNELFLMFVPNIINLLFVVTDLIIFVILICIFPVQISVLSVCLAVITFLISFPLTLIPLLIIRSFSFWVGNIFAIESAYKSVGYSFQNYPIKILSKVFFMVFVAITPMGYLHWYLTLVILVGKVSYSWMLWMWLLIIVLDVFMWFVFRFVYKRGLRRYEGFA